MNTDQFGALGKSKESQFLELVAVLENLATQETFSAEEKFLLLKNTLLNEIQNMTGPKTKSRVLALNLAQRLDKDVKAVEDVVISRAVRPLLWGYKAHIVFKTLNDKMGMEVSAMKTF